MNETANSPISGAGQFDRAAWIAQAKALLDDSADELDAATLSRLNRARQAALAVRHRRAPAPWFVPAGLVSACALVLALAVWSPHHVGLAGSGKVPSANAVAIDALDAESAVDDDSLDFYQDLDFYAWLDAQGKGGDG